MGFLDTPADAERYARLMLDRLAVNRAERRQAERDPATYARVLQRCTPADIDAVVRAMGYDPDARAQA